MKCDLCGADEAIENGLLCAACREAIVRLLIISEKARSDAAQACETAPEAVERPEIRQNTRKAGS